MKGNGILADDGRAVIVALDHGLFTTKVPTLDAMVTATREVLAGGADGVMVTPGLLRRLGQTDANAVLRIDRAANVTEWNGQTTVPLAIDLRGASSAAVMAVTHHSGEAEQLTHLSALIDASHRHHLPVMAEMLPGNYVRQDAYFRSGLVAESGRLGVELGADVIKTRYVDDGGFEQAVAHIGLPVLILGGPKEGHPLDLLTMVSQALQAGARGVAMGRNIWGYSSPRQMVRALGEVIHHGATPQEALQILEESL